MADCAGVAVVGLARLAPEGAEVSEQLRAVAAGRAAAAKRGRGNRDMRSSIQGERVRQCRDQYWKRRSRSHGYWSRGSERPACLRRAWGMVLPQDGGTERRRLQSRGCPNLMLEPFPPIAQADPR